MIKTIYHRIFRQRMHFRSLSLPFINYKINTLGDYLGINQAQRERQVVVTLYSDYENFSELPMTIYSILNQSLMPDKVVLYLNSEHEKLVDLPYEITQFVKNGLEIRFVKKIKSYTVIINSFKDFPDSIIITAENNIFYSKNWLKRLYMSYVSNPEDIQVYKAGRVDFFEKNIKSISTWKYNWGSGASFLNFIKTETGVLYPPSCFSKEVLRQDVFLKYAPEYSEIWIWIMALVHKRKIRVVKNNFGTFSYINFWKELSNGIQNKNSFLEFDSEMQSLLKLYSNRVKHLLI